MNINQNPKSIYWVFLTLIFLGCTSVEVVKIEEIRGDPPLTLIHLTDLHLRNQDAQYTEVVKKVQEINPDIVVITGDHYSEKGRHELVIWFLDQLSSVKHKAAILGNHEYWSGENLDETREVFESRGWAFLVNQEVEWTINERMVRVYGVDDLISGQWGLEGIDPALVDIFLIHEPELFDLILESSPDLTGKIFLAGHTHGGQITFFGKSIFLPQGTKDYDRGIFRKNGNMLFVSKGLGNSGPRFRFFADYDIGLLTF